jgi:uncharacterized protein
VTRHDFDAGILEQTDHRPWPIPGRPWVMTQTWHDLLFAHWPVDKVLLAQKVPAPLELELYNGEAWIAIVPFHMTNVAPRGVPSLPVMSEFPELNVRTYVRAGSKPGVFFFSLDAGNPLAVTAARTLFNLPYFTSTMTVEENGGRIRYSSRRVGSTGANFEAEYQPTGPVFHAQPGSLEYFLTERYCLYTVADGSASRVDVHHRPWALQEAEAAIRVNTMTDPIGIRLPGRTPLLHFSKRQDVVAWLPAGDDSAR